MLLEVPDDERKAAEKRSRENDRFLQNSLFVGVFCLISMEKRKQIVRLNTLKEFKFSMFTHVLRAVVVKICMHCCFCIYTHPQKVEVFSTFNRVSDKTCLLG